ncbi:MAG: hypothetical protein ACTS9Y_12205 [Methylophilus sp.]|uniref:hypothetical protein n=1 Tax=Methylophilus sp. TaxID=29541 RepID=UPI003FA0E107
MNLTYASLADNKLSKPLIYLFWAAIFLLYVISAAKYTGQAHVYLIFSITSNLLLYFGFRKNAVFFDTFIGIFFWIGFWLKCAIRLISTNGVFYVPVGNFDGSAAAFDQGLLVSSVAFLGLLVASLLREHFLFNYPEKIDAVKTGLFDFYIRYRKSIWVAFLVLILFIGASNVYLGIYQRGGITKTVLPFGLNGVYKWLLLFGLASISAVILWLEFQIKKSTSITVILLALIEAFISNVSLLSRGMILNSSALLYGILKCLKFDTITFKLRHIILTFFVFSFLFISSVYLVNFLRASLFNDSYTDEEVVQEMHSSTTPLFIDRWVGMEGVLSVSSYPKLGWPLWKEAVNEVYNENQTSFYDNNFIESSYVKTDKSKHHFISLPGIVAFFFYPGSFVFLFFAMLTVGFGAALIEYATYQLGGKNVILCSLFAQVIAFRFASFGYVPKQSYLLFGSLALNILLIFIANKYLSTRSKSHSK